MKKLILSLTLVFACAVAIFAQRHGYNNTITSNVCPDFVITQMTATPSTTSQGNSLVVNAHIMNVGNQNYTPGNPSLYRAVLSVLTPNGYVVVKQDDIYALVANQNVFILTHVMPLPKIIPGFKVEIVKVGNGPSIECTSGNNTKIIKALGGGSGPSSFRNRN